MTEDQIKHMASRFLAWKLPEGFNPDGGISFEPVGNKGTPHEFARQPSGTNLWGWDEAVAMVRHMAEGMPDDPVSAAMLDAAALGTGFLQITRIDPNKVAIEAKSNATDVVDTYAGADGKQHPVTNLNSAS